MHWFMEYTVAIVMNLLFTGLVGGLWGDIAFVNGFTWVKWRILYFFEIIFSLYVLSKN